MDIAVNSLKDQPALRVLAHEVGRTYGVNPDIHSQTTEAEYDAALMGVGYLAAVYSIAIQTRISIN